MANEDVFDQAISADFQEPQEDQTPQVNASPSPEGDDKSGDNEEKAEPEKEQQQEQPPTLETLQAKIADLEKVNKGQYGGLKAERQKRQEYEAKINQLEGRLTQINDLLAKVREGRGTKADEQKADQLTEKLEKKGIPVQFDEEGNAFIPEESLADFLKTSSNPVKQDVDKIQARDAIRAQQEQYISATNAVLSKDEAFPTAYQSLTKAFAFLDKGLTGIVEDQGLDAKTLDLTKAVELMEASPELTGEFARQFPGLDMDMVIEALQVSPDGQINPRKLTKALNALKSSTNTQTPGKEDGKNKTQTLKALATKASNLGKVSNQRASLTPPTLNEIANIDPWQVMNLSDDEFTKLAKLATGED